jgi:hypothetical protein
MVLAKENNILACNVELWVDTVAQKLWDMNIMDGPTLLKELLTVNNKMHPSKATTHQFDAIQMFFHDETQ